MYVGNLEMLRNISLWIIQLHASFEGVSLQAFFAVRYRLVRSLLKDESHQTDIQFRAFTLCSWFVPLGHIRIDEVTWQTCESRLNHIINRGVSCYETARENLSLLHCKTSQHKSVLPELFKPWHSIIVTVLMSHVTYSVIYISVKNYRLFLS